MRNMFYYTRKEEVKKPDVNGEKQPVEYKEFTDSFNMEKVIRTYEMPEYLMVILDDFHQEKREQPIFNKKGQYTGKKFEISDYSSVIELLKEDAERYRKLTSVE